MGKSEEAIPRRGALCASETSTRQASPMVTRGNLRPGGAARTAFRPPGDRGRGGPPPSDGAPVRHARATPVSGAGPGLCPRRGVKRDAPEQMTTSKCPNRSPAPDTRPRASHRRPHNLTTADARAQQRPRGPRLPEASAERFALPRPGPHRRRKGTCTVSPHRYIRKREDVDQDGARSGRFGRGARLHGPGGLTRAHVELGGLHFRWQHREHRHIVPDGERLRAYSCRRPCRARGAAVPLLPDPDPSCRSGDR